ncbi:thiamine-phosphate synthase [Cellvibrio zantedeschiae]|uniref:Thiamine-phosphate synthase n=1 Tax=Cellvibrio zantedeschiae TaxID=1237077 RepID=A0ABQ3B682_9GAMM|nr:thiamine phosphate synthase [Cellvibrio zantedeschiae]GGY81136.1 thiamine-phosphate synthase [Cellvibrio zantedeschiae]
MNYLYAITDSTLMPGEALFTGVESALKGGCMLVQYRDKSNDAAKRLHDATHLLNVCNQYNAQLIINDDVQLAHQIKAHGVHLGQGDGDVKAARTLLGEAAVIGVTCHNSLALAEKAIADGATYIAFGRFFSSNTKPDARPAPLGLLTEAKKQFPNTMIAAIGGITHENAASVTDAGANLIAVCHSLFAAQDIEAQAKLFIERI